MKIWVDDLGVTAPENNQAVGVNASLGNCTGAGIVGLGRMWMVEQMWVLLWAAYSFSGSPSVPRSLPSSVDTCARVATRVSWSPLSGLKGVQPPLPFGPYGFALPCELGPRGPPQLREIGRAHV